MRSGRGGKFGWNYPPGAANDPSAPYNQPDHSHDHEWEPVERDYPIFEDGAAIFVDTCRYAEGRYGDGWSCEETRSFRCDLERVVKVRENAPNVAYLVSDEHPGDRWSHVERIFEEVLMALCPYAEDGDILDLDPPNDYGDGFVRVRIGDYEVVYSQ